MEDFPDVVVILYFFSSLSESEDCFCDLWKNCADNVSVEETVNKCKELRKDYKCPQSSQSRLKKSAEEEREQSGFAALVSHVSGLRTVYSNDKKKKKDER